MGTLVLVLLLKQIQIRYHLDFVGMKEKIKFKFSRNIGVFPKDAHIVDDISGKYYQ